MVCVRWACWGEQVQSTAAPWPGRGCFPELLGVPAGPGRAAAQSGLPGTACCPCSEASGHTAVPTLLRPCHRCPLPTGVVMVFSTSAFGAYFKLTQGGPSNSSHMELLAPISVEPASASLGLAWLAVGSVCLFTAGKRGSGGGGGQWTHVTLKFLWLPVRSCPVRLSITWVPPECSWL